MGKRSQILIVDDDPDICVMIRMMLQYKGYHVIVVDSPVRVIDELRSGDINVVLMDMLLSGFNGIDICKLIKNDDTISHIPLIMMSAYSDASFKCYEAGANDFISKPFEIMDLLGKIQQAEKTVDGNF